MDGDLSVEVKSFEIWMDKSRPYIVGHADVIVLPIGIHINSVRVNRSGNDFVFKVPTIRVSGRQISAVRLPSYINDLMRRAIVARLREVGILKKKEDEPKPISAVPLFYDPDQIEENENV